MVLRAGGRAGERERGRKTATERAAGKLAAPTDTTRRSRAAAPDSRSQGAEVTWSSTPAGDVPVSLLTARLSQWRAGGAQ